MKERMENLVYLPGTTSAGIASETDDTTTTISEDQDPGGRVPRTASGTVWLNYEQAAEHTSYSVGHLRNLVSADQIPVYGPARSRRFRLDMLDLWLTDREAAMRKFQLERNSHGD
jgi:hypothetical protein